MTQDYSRQQVLDIIEAEARERGIPRDDFLRFAYIETGGTFDERASRGPRGAKGLFQFIPSTAAAYSIAGRELDPVVNTDAAARLYLDNRRSLEAMHARDGRPYLSGKPAPDGLDMYMAHQQGTGGYQSLQAALTTGSFSRRDTRANILNNVSPRDLKEVTGESYDDFAKMSDRDLARTFVAYWDTKFDRVGIPEKSIEPRREGIVAPATPTQARAPVQAPATVALNRAYELSVEHDDVRYRMGSKSVSKGSIDCSGWVVMLQNATMSEINAEAGREIFCRSELFNPGMDGAAMIVQKAAQRSGRLLEGRQVNAESLREGMVIGEDNGRTSWDAGRFRGIDHITMVVRNPANGQLMVSQSRGGEGVEIIPLDRYLRDKQSRGVRLFAADPLHEARVLIDDGARVEPSVAQSPSATKAATRAEADSLLQPGEKGPAVAVLQQRLAELGYHGRDGKPLGVDGDFGENTKFALQAFQRDHGLEGRGVAGPRTEAALERAERSLMSHPTHPHHAMYARILEKVQAEDRARGIASGRHSEHIAAALAVECLREGITRIDQVEFSADHRLVRVVQASPMRDEPGLNRSTDGISVAQAIRQSMAESSEQIHQVAVNRQAQQQQEQLQRTQLQPAARALAH